MTLTKTPSISDAKPAFDISKLPAPTDEPWRKIDLRGLDVSQFTAAAAMTELDLHIPEGVEVEAIHFDPENLNAAVIQKISEMSSAKTGRTHDYFEDFNALHFQRGVHLQIRGASDKPLVIRHNLLSGRMLAHRVFINVVAQSKVTIIEEYSNGSGSVNAGQTHSDLESLWVPYSLVVAQANAEVNHINRSQFDDHTWNFGRIRYSQYRDSRIKSAWIHEGGYRGKVVIHADVNESGTNFRGIGIKAGVGSEFCDVDVGVQHNASHSQSSLMYKMVLTDKAHSVFTGNLEIAPQLIDVDSHQENHNILLTDTARAQSMPHLLIHAEDVACEHGATVGALDQQALFFLMARGLSEDKARNLLIEAFLNAVLAELDLPDYAGQIIESFKAKLAL